MIKPDWEKNGIQLFNCDCREILPHIGAVDHVITDPPYARDVYLRMRKADSNRGGKRHAIKNGGAIVAMRNGAIGNINLQLDTSAECSAKLVRRWCLVFSDVENCHAWRAALETNGLRYIRTGAWVKPNAMPQMTGDRPGVGFEPCSIFHGPSKPMRWNGGGFPALWTYNTCQVNRPDHPCPKPELLMIQLVRDFTDPGETILDPFMGSGTTGVACVRLGRKFIGIEIEERYFSIAVSRIEKAMEETSLLDWGHKQEQVELC